METAIIILAAILALAGIIGNLAPALPGTPLNFIALLLLEYATGGDAFGTPLLVVLGVLTAGSLAFDLIVPVLTARRFGASKQGLWGSFLGTFIGLVVLSLPGMVIGMIAGAVGGEVYAGKTHGEALKAGAATIAGNVLSVLLRLGLSLAMTVLFIIALF